MHTTVGPGQTAHADPVLVTEGRVNAHRVNGVRIVHHHGQACVAAGRQTAANFFVQNSGALPRHRDDFHPRLEFLARGIRRPQTAVGQGAARARQLEPRAVCHRLGLRAAQRQFHPQIAVAHRPLGDHKILPHAVHAHGVFLGQPGPEVAHQFVGHRDFTGARQRPVECQQPRRVGQPISAPDRAGNQVKPAAVTRRGGLQPQAFRRGAAFEFLKTAAQPRTVAGGRHRECVTLVICRGFRPDLREGNRCSVWRGRTRR